MTNRGGKRMGAGRPKGTNHYGEPTKPVRIPVSKVDRVLRFVREREDMVPLYGNEVPAGFPSPADDYAEGVPVLRRVGGYTMPCKALVQILAN